MSQVAALNVLDRAAELRSRISDARALAASLEETRSQAAKALRQAKLRHGYRRLQQWIRIPADSYSLWPVGIWIVASLLSGLLALMFVALFVGSTWSAFVMGAMAALATAFLLGHMLWGTSSAEVPQKVEQAVVDLREARDALAHIGLEIDKVASSLKVDEEQLHSLRHSIQWNQDRLLRSNWRAMRDSEWEHFLAEVFRANGWEATVLGQSGDQGVDLIAMRNNRRYAIQAKGYHHSVGNKAVQEAVAGMAHYGCNACAVITNSRYTRSAIELAASNCCLLIGEADIPNFVRGQLEPFRSII